MLVYLDFKAFSRSCILFCNFTRAVPPCNSKQQHITLKGGGATKGQEAKSFPFYQTMVSTRSGRQKEGNKVQSSERNKTNSRCREVGVLERLLIITAAIAKHYNEYRGQGR